jgi:hypothetical protein
MFPAAEERTKMPKTVTALKCPKPQSVPFQNRTHANYPNPLKTPARKPKLYRLMAHRRNCTMGTVLDKQKREKAGFI